MEGNVYSNLGSADLHWKKWYCILLTGAFYFDAYLRGARCTYSLEYTVQRFQSSGFSLNSFFFSSAASCTKVWANITFQAFVKAVQVF